MVYVVKSEWHQVEKRYGLQIDEDTLAQIYPDLEEEEISEMMEDLESGELGIEEVVDAAWEEGVDLDWDWLDEDDWWTDRKGGYEVTYKIED